MVIMETPATLHKTSLTCSIADERVLAEVSISDCYETILKFSLHGKAFKFEITQWQKRDMTSFLYKFFSFAKRDPQEFGTHKQDSDGIGVFVMTTEQKVNVAIQGAKDIMKYIDMVVTHYKNCTLSYAVWYLDNHRDGSTYDTFIEMIACELLVQNKFVFLDAFRGKLPCFFVHGQQKINL